MLFTIISIQQKDCFFFFSENLGNSTIMQKKGATKQKTKRRNKKRLN
jgi:hypothetical protein